MVEQWIARGLCSSLTCSNHSWEGPRVDGCGCDERCSIFEGLFSRRDASRRSVFASANHVHGAFAARTRALLVARRASSQTLSILGMRI